MKTRQKTLTCLPEAKDLGTLLDISPHLLLVFGTPSFFEDQTLYTRLRLIFPDTLLLGTSSGGNISRQGLEDDALQLTAIHFDNPALAWAYCETASDDDSLEAGIQLGSKLAPHQPRHILLFAHRLNTSGHRLLQGIKQILPSVSITGGIASNMTDSNRSFTLDPEGCSSRRNVALAFCSPQIRTAFGASSGWRPFGPTRRVTRGQHNHLFELDGEPALDMYRRYLGHHMDNWAYARLLFSFEMLDAEGKETGLIRAVQRMNEEDGSLTLTDDIIEGGYLRLMHASTNSLVNGSEVAVERALRHPQPSGEKLALVVSCIGRRIVMGQQTEEEIEVVTTHFNSDFCIAGYYSQGEYGNPNPDSHECQIMNETMSVTLLGEAPC